MATIQSARKVHTSDPSAWAWAALRKFQNVEFVSRRIVQLHRLDPKWAKHSKKQARQLRYCLIQAREYFTAAQTVSLATKPNLLYYGIMSLALAEILFKQSGESSLDMSRGENQHHGLIMTAGAIPTLVAASLIWKRPAKCCSRWWSNRPKNPLRAFPEGTLNRPVLNSCQNSA
jgi:YaaC-like Protein